mmetsp:Transcript_6511/g.13060  ORF Transcript_6511/g.13060 Transcript_6511/m.13060 type:complete len:139 (+) Transcript_6511:674-1090(+)
MIGFLEGQYFTIPRRPSSTCAFPSSCVCSLDVYRLRRPLAGISSPLLRSVLQLHEAVVVREQEPTSDSFPAVVVDFLPVDPTASVTLQRLLLGGVVPGHIRIRRLRQSLRRYPIHQRLGISSRYTSSVFSNSSGRHDD